MRQSMVLAIACGGLAIVCLVAAGLAFVERPTIIRVAVPTENQGDRDLLTAAGKVVRHGRHPIRFKVVVEQDAATVATSLDAGQVDMAVVRTDGSMPSEGQTVVILHRDAAILVASGSSGIKDVAGLAGHTIGIVEASDPNRDLLNTVLAQSDVDPGAVKTVRLGRAEVAAAVKSNAVDAVLVVGILSGASVQEAVHAVAQGGEGAPVFIPVEEAAAIAQRSSAYESFEIVKGAFRGAPPRPAEEYDTLSVTHRLVASTGLSQSVVADVTRFFLSERNAIVALNPIARSIEEPSTDKGSALPAHPGTAAYIDDEEESFLDRYSDFFYLGAMMLGVFASGATAIFSRFNAQGAKAVEQLTARLIEILKLVRFAPSLELVTGLETETDEIVAAALEQNMARSLDERRLGALGLALDQVREAIRDRRMVLTGAPAEESRQRLGPHAVMAGE